MPTYDYKCRSCGSVFEVSRSAHDASDQPCPACGSASKRLFSPVGIVFKGSGFHNTDYKPKAHDSAPEGDHSSTSRGCDGASPACATCPSASAT